MSGCVGFPSGFPSLLPNLSPGIAQILFHFLRTFASLFVVAPCAGCQDNCKWNYTDDSHNFYCSKRRAKEKRGRLKKGSAAVCSRCHLPAPGYDQLAERRFEFIPLWGFLSGMRVFRSKCC